MKKKVIGNAILYCGDCEEVLSELTGIDTCVTDPPYGLSFMGKKWDYDVPSKELWKQVYNTLKPGAHLLSFFGSRTYHRGVIPIEDAGFDIRDQIMWIYGSGFPKSHNIGKAVDKRSNVDLTEFSKALRNKRIELGYTLGQADELITGGTTMYSFLEGRKDNNVYPPNRKYWEKIKEHFGMEGWEKVIENNLKIIGEKEGSYGYQKDGQRWKNSTKETETTSELAEKWNGWGTALKPAHEPIVMARKPFKGSVAENVLEHGTGGINIDGCRVGINPEIDDKRLGGQGEWKTDKTAKNVYEGGYEGKNIASSEQGRFPANVMHDGSEEVLEIFPITKSTAARYFYCAKTSRSERNEGLDHLPDGAPQRWNKAGEWTDDTTPSKNHHPTVKPVELMKYLCRLVTPKDRIVLDPFMGSGSTGVAALAEGFYFIGIEKEEEYFDIACARLQHFVDNQKTNLEKTFGA